MRKNDVCAIIVTHNYNYNDLKACIKSIINQVKEIIIVDNASLEANQLIDIINGYDDISIKFNNKNLGIAAALNIGIKLAAKKKYKWILSLDQDSNCKEFFIEKLLSAYENLPPTVQNGVGMVVPNWVDINLKNSDLESESDKIYEIQSAITSGAIYKSEIFDKVGLFEEKLFIDQVDHEFCLRLNLQNYKILKIESCILNHKLGDSISKKFIMWNVVVTNHSPVRRYYITRNRIYVANKYKYNYPKLRVSCIKKILKDLLLIITYEGKKIEKVKMIIKGIYDAKNSRFGAYGEANKK